MFLKQTSLAIVLLCPLSAHAADRPEKSAETLCWTARAAVAAYGSEKAAEEAARAKGVSEAMIERARRCKR